MLDRVMEEAAALDKFFTAAAQGPALSIEQETLVIDCIGLFAYWSGQGDARGTRAWGAAGATHAGLRKLCKSLVLENPKVAVSMQVELRAIKRFLANARPAQVATLPPLAWVPAIPDSNGGGWGGGGGDLDCEDIGAETWVGDYDPHGFDGDGDGWGCEGW